MIWRFPGGGYGSKFARALLSYWKGNHDVLPLDGKALKALHDLVFYRSDKTGSLAREDIESKIKIGLPLIDFHELLRFRGQTGGRSSDQFNDRDFKVIVGWNAWRLLSCTNHAKVTEDWIYKNLIKDGYVAKKLWQFYRRIE